MGFWASPPPIHVQIRRWGEPVERLQPHRRARTSPAGRALKSSLERICVGSLLQQRGSDGAVRHGKLVDGGAAAARLTGRVH